MLSSSSDEESGFVYMSASSQSTSTEGGAVVRASGPTSGLHSNDRVSPPISPGQSDDESSAGIHNQFHPQHLPPQRDLMINFLRLHPPKNPRVSQLRQECRTDPGPNSARNSHMSSYRGEADVTGVLGSYARFSHSSPSISSTVATVADNEQL